MPLAVCLALLIALLAGDLALGGGSSRSAAGGGKVAPVETIARRVEAIRGLKFKTLPKPKRVSAAQAKSEGLRDLDRSYPAARRRADEELYKLLGLLAPAVDLRMVSSDVYEGQVAGYYDPRSGALRVVDSGAPPNRVADETTLAHELVHALEDQRYDLELDDLESSGDGALAYTALVEGTATAVMDEYQRRHFKPSDALGGAVASAFGASGAPALPPFVMAQLIFPYLGGAEFVGSLYDTAGETWRLVDIADRVRPPVSTEQVLHPEKYLRLEAPLRVPLRGVGRSLGAGWRRVAGETFGEWQTREWLGRGAAGGAARAAEGWGGDRFELWRRGSFDGCKAPCAARDVLVMRWEMDTARDADELRAAASTAVRARAGGGAAVVTASGGREVTVVLAPDDATARRLSRVR